MGRSLPWLAVCLATILLAFFLFVFSQPHVDWLRAATPSRAFRGNAFPLRIRLVRPDPGMYLDVDLHWMTAGKIPRGYLAGSRPVKLVEGVAVHDFSIPTGTAEDAAFIFGVVYLSREGNWGTRIKVAWLEPVPILDDDGSGARWPMEARIARGEAREEAPGLEVESAPLRFLAAFSWLAVAALGFAGGRRIGGTAWIVAAGMLCAVWEALDAAGILAEALRSLSMRAGAYDERDMTQRILTVAVAVLAGLAALALVRMGRSRDAGWATTWACVAAYWGVSLLRAISLHRIDALLSRSIAGMGVGQLARLAAAVACLLVLALKLAGAGPSGGDRGRRGRDPRR